MAEFVDFKGSNRQLLGFKHEALPGGECGDLPVQQMPDGYNISCWKLTEEELAEVAKTGVVWLMVYGGHPPVCVVGEKPFKIVPADSQESDDAADNST